MSIGNFDEVKAYFTNNKDNEDVKSFVTELNPITLDRVRDFVGKDKDAQSWFDSEKDKHFSKGLETFKSNNLQKLIDEEYRKQHPEADPKDTEIAKLKADFDNMKKEADRKELTNKALKIATEKKLPASLINYFIGDDEEITVKNLEALEKAFNDSVNVVVEERLKSGYKPPKSNNSQLSAEEQIKAEVNKYFGIK